MKNEKVTCRICGKSLQIGRKKLCNKCVVNAYMNAKSENERRSYKKTMIRRGISVPACYKRCDCGALLDSAHHVKCTDCVFDELATTGDAMRRHNLYLILQHRGYDVITIDEIVKETRRKINE